MLSNPRFASFLIVSAGFWFVCPGDIHADDNKPIVITGQVVDEQNQPVAGASVFVPRIRSESQMSATTDPDGQFELELNPNFNWSSFVCIATSEDRSLQGFVQSDNESQAIPTPVTIALEPARTIPVTVIDADGDPVTGAEILAIARNRVFATTLSNGDGRATLRVPEGLTLSAVAAVKNGEGLDYVNFRQQRRQESNPARLSQDFDEALTFQLHGARNVVVYVTDNDGKPLSGVRVHAWYFNLPDKGDRLNFSGWDPKLQYTDSDGKASFGFVPANNEGPITFRADKDGEYLNRRVNFDPSSFVDRVDITLDKLMSVRGRVVDLRGEPVTGAGVFVIGDSHAFDSHQTSAKTGENGYFDAKLAPNHFYLIVARKETQISPGQTLVVKDETPNEPFLLTLQPSTRVHGKVTVGSEKSPQADVAVSLNLEPSPDYYKLPEEHRFPNPKDSRTAISPRYVQWTKTDNHGNYELWAGPGDYYMFGPRNIDPPRFTITDETEKEVNFHAERPETVELTGRVVYKDQLEKPLASTTVFIYADRAQSTRYPRPVTDAEGRFSCKRSYTRCLAYTATEDNSHAAIVPIDIEQREVEIQVEPTSTATGRLISSETDQPLVGVELRYGVKVYTGEEGNSPWMTLFGGTATTTPDGGFELRGLLPRYEYGVSVVNDRDGDGRARSWRTVGKVELEAAGPFDLGDLLLTPAFKPPTLEEQIAGWFAEDKDLAERFEVKLRDARIGHQHFLAIVSAPEHSLCQAFFEMMYDYQNEERRRFYGATAHFVLLAAQQKKIRESSGLPAGVAGLGRALYDDESFRIAVFSETGKLLGIVRESDLETDGRLDFEKLYAFLALHTPEIPDAKQLVDAAFKQAKRENKRVLWQHSGAFCGPCILLARYFDEHRELIEKDYVWVKIDSRYTHGQEMIDTFRTEGVGIPWFVVLDADRKPLINSTSEAGNIGFPSSETGRRHFRTMLGRTAQRLTEVEIDRLIKSLENS
jgi:protocatechuate 3,4-dioxygenase beta subunit